MNSPSLLSLANPFLSYPPCTNFSHDHASLLDFIPGFLPSRLAFELDLSTNHDFVDTLICLPTNKLGYLSSVLQASSGSSPLHPNLLAFPSIVSAAASLDELVYLFDHVWFEIDHQPKNFLNLFLGSESSYLSRDDCLLLADSALKFFAPFFNGAISGLAHNFLYNSLSPFFDSGFVIGELGAMCRDNASHLKCLFSLNYPLSFDKFLSLPLVANHLGFHAIERIHNSGLLDSVMAFDHQCKLSVAFYSSYFLLAVEITPLTRSFDLSQIVSIWDGLIDPFTLLGVDASRLSGRSARLMQFPNVNVQSRINHFKLSFLDGQPKVKIYFDCCFSDSVHAPTK